jgi:zinc protease
MAIVAGACATKARSAREVTPSRTAESEEPDARAANESRRPSARELAVPYTSFRLANGLHVVIHEDHRVPMAAVAVVYHVGSGREDAGKTGFAHLFEHVMFEGSANVPEGAFDVWLEEAGGDNSGFTNNDYTGYYEVVPRNALELALFLEADRMATLLATMDQRKLDVQRDVVKNERRERYDNQPYGLARILIAQALYPPGHPYHWPTIGSMRDLSAASLLDVQGFFRRYYVPANATLVVAGDVGVDEVEALVRKHFDSIPNASGPPPFHAPPARLERETRLVQEDDVQLPRLYMAWISPPYFAPGDAALDLLAILLAEGKSSRLYKRLVYELQMAQDVRALQSSGKLASSFTIEVTARSGRDLDQILRVIDEEIEHLRREPPTERETRRCIHLYEASFYDQLEPALGRALAFASYDFYTANPGYFDETLAAHRAVDSADLQQVTRQYLNDRRVLLSIVPNGQAPLALERSTVAREEAR